MVVDAAVISNAPKRIACFGPFLLFLGALVALLRLSDNGATFQLSELCIVLLLRCHAVSSTFFSRWNKAITHVVWAVHG